MIPRQNLNTVSFIDKCPTNLNICIKEPTINFNKSFSSFNVPCLISSNFNFFTDSHKKDSKKSCVLRQNGSIFSNKGNENNAYFSKKQKPDQFGSWFRWKNIDDRFYYQNKITGNTQWDEPIDVKQGLNRSNWIQVVKMFCNVSNYS